MEEQDAQCYGSQHFLFFQSRYESEAEAGASVLQETIVAVSDQEALSQEGGVLKGLVSAQELLLVTAERERIKWFSKLDALLRSLQQLVDAFREAGIPSRMQAAHARMLAILLLDLEDRQLIIQDLKTQRDVRILTTYQNVWRLSPRLSSPDLQALRAVLNS